MGISSSKCAGLHQFTKFITRIYKAKYMDDASKSADKDKSRGDGTLSSLGKDTKDKEARPTTRSRARSFWGRSKKDIPTS